MPGRTAATIFALAIAAFVHAEDGHHAHPVPEKLGKVNFATSCATAVQPAFERAVALLHSFAYSASEQAFRDIAAKDPRCAMAYWGMAMSHYHPLWEPPMGDELRTAAAQANKAVELRAGTPRERQFIDALAIYYRDPEHAAPAVRAERYAAAMANVAQENRQDSEAQIFYALALIATAPPTDKTHANQKRAVAILEPLYRQQPQHPGLAHYLIHATDSAELASQGLAAAREYSKIAPSVPHALHMPSHIFTRLGLWDDSIASNRAARAAAHDQGDVGEELHAMDYLTYAYLQRARNADASQLLAELRSMSNIHASEFKEGYAATAMTVRFAVERQDWASTTLLEARAGSKPHVAALVYWAKALGKTRGKPAASADAEIARLEECRLQLRSAGIPYWETQVDVLLKEAKAWQSMANGDPEAAVNGLRAAAEQEDAVEKLPVTPGPIVPAREQLGELLLQLKRPEEALKEFREALTSAPRRRGAMVGAIAAAESSGNREVAKQLQADMSP